MSSDHTTLAYPLPVYLPPTPSSSRPTTISRKSTNGDKTMPPPAFLPRKRKLAPAQSSPSTSSASPTPDRDMEDEEYAPASGPSKRNKAGSGSSAKNANAARGMSREQLRKANHSLIERRRREKINAALGELRDMVPDLAGEAKGGEFKLEVLERTVAYMKELKSIIAELEGKLSSQSSPNGKSKSPTTPGLMASPPVPSSSKVLEAKARPSLPRRPHNASTTPPSPSLSPDPNETEPENNLPPAYAVASRIHTPTIASLLQTASEMPTTSSAPFSSRPSAVPQAPNPSLYLPFPTPSPTSPFLTYHGTSSSSSGSSGPPEPSPFLAPLQGMSLFGGALNLDAGAKDSKDMKAEEAANVLLAFSSPDTLKPVIGAGLGLTPKMVPANGSRERRLTLESEDFILDGGVREGGRTGARSGIVGKTARDILKM